MHNFLGEYDNDLGGSTGDVMVEIVPRGRLNSRERFQA